ncbi:MAG: SDR family NAD(P)-dependent oxidoreductase [Pseudomonadota bacterium]
MASNYSSYTPSCVFITGATGGFGKAFVERFDQDGTKLIIHGRNQEKLEELSQAIQCDHHLVCFDLADKAAIEKSLSSLPKNFQDIDLLINNAGGALGLDKFHEADMADLLSMIDMNNKSLIQITRLVMPMMVKNKKGHVINIGSIAGNWPYPGGHVYCAVKSFVKQFSLALRADLEGTNIRVTNIEPGMAETPFSVNRFKGDEKKAEAVYAKTTPLTADDIAESVYWSACLPAHVNINSIELMPTQQSFAALKVERNG